MDDKPQLKNPVVAALLSAILPGAGQIYNGDAARGIAVFAIFGCSLWTLLIFIGVILVPIVYLVGIFDAAAGAKMKNSITVEQSNCQICK